MNPFERPQDDLSDLPRLQYLREQVQTSTNWLRAYTQTCQALLQQQPPPSQRIRELQYRIAHEIGTLRNFLQAHHELNTRNRTLPLTISHLSRNAEELIHHAENLLRQPPRPKFEGPQQKILVPNQLIPADLRTTPPNQQQKKS